MKKSVLLAGFLSICFLGTLQAQNKTLGVGVTTPNPNAALHVESPTSNQGFIMPRLTTAQRTAPGFTSILATADNGLMVYDVDLKTLYVWDGTTWKTSAEVATTGTGSAGRFEINNPVNTSHALYAQTNADTLGAAIHGNNLGHGFGVFGKSAGTKFASAAVYGEHVGTGDAAGAFRISNPGNPYSGLFGETNGSGAAIFGNQIGLGRAGQFQIQNGGNSQAALRAYTDGTGRSGFFTINNPTNTSSGLYTETNGNGHALEAIQTGTGNGILASSANATGLVAISSGPVSSAIEAYKTDGGGNSIQAGHNGANTHGDGNAIYGFADGGNSNAIKGTIVAGNGNAGVFEANGGGSGNAIFATNNGTGATLQAQTSTGFTAIYGRREGATNGNAGLFDIADAANTYPALQANTIGTGSAGNFQINNNSSGAPALFAQTNGTGTAISALHTGSAGDAVYIERQGSGNGSSGYFTNTNGSNNATALMGSTNAAGGYALGATNTANGVALAIWGGGMKVTTETVTTTTIANRTMAYHITGGGTTFTFGFGPTQGDVFLVYNDTGAGISVEGVAIPNGEGRTLVHFGGAGFRSF